MKDQLFAVLALSRLAVFGFRISIAHFTSFVRATSRSVSKDTLPLFSIAVLLTGGAAAVRGQSALDGFDPNANGAINVVVVQPDAKILIGGGFTTLSPNGGAAVTRNNIARLNPDGTLDTAFNPNANGAVNALAVQADGKIIASGHFNGTNSIGGQPRNYIARIDATTGAADSFNPNANGPVFSVAVQADGKILAGGNFLGANSIGGQTRNFIARLDATTGLADSFNPNANDIVYALAVQADGNILAGGPFTSIGGQTRRFMARLNAATGLADSFNPNIPGGIVFTIAVQADGKILAGGGFAEFAPNGGTAVTRNNIARLETDGRLDQTLNYGIDANGVISAVAVQPDGKTLIGGGFFAVLGAPRTNLARLNTDGTLDTAFNPSVDGFVSAIAVQADGKILVAGGFTTVSGQARNNFARLDATNGLPDSFNPNPSSDISSIAVQADGKILVIGTFATIGGEERRNIARLDATTGFADSFNPDVNANVNPLFTAIAVQADGKILVAGNFSGANSIGGQTRNHIARLNPDGTVDTVFDPNSEEAVGMIAVQADGRILVAGSFYGTNSIGGQSRNFIARLDATTGAADSFDPSPNTGVNSIVVQADGKVLVGGGFDAVFPGISIGGQTRHFIARLNATNGSADTFNSIANSLVSSIAVQTDGKVLVGGPFTSIGGQTRSHFARLNNDTFAVQNLAVSQTTITWTRGGSGPQFPRVSFEYSTNNVNYTFLGSGTAIGSNWTLTGLNLPTGQSLYIRARGYYRSGRQNASESITESVRNVFLATPPRLNIQRSANANVVLSWATNFPGFTLESNTNLNPNVWSVVSPAPAVSGTNNVVTNAVSGSARFYRLRK